MMSRNAPRPTKAEKARIDRMISMGCILTWAKFGRKERAECHHLTECRKRLGHEFTIPLSPWYHRGIVPYPYSTRAEARAVLGASLADGSKAFIRDHGYTERELWERMQMLLGLEADWPQSKRVPRRAA